MKHKWLHRSEGALHGGDIIDSAVNSIGLNE